MNRRYYPTPNRLRSDVWIDGANVLLRGPDLTPECFLGFGAALVNLGDTEMFIDLAEHPTIGQTYVKLTTGSAVSWRNFSLWYCGTGAIYWGSGSSLDTASSTLKVKTTTSVTPLVVGLAAPATAPGFFESATASLKLTGTRSCVFTEANSLTGWESNISPVSAIVTFHNHKAIISFPALINTLSGADGFYLYITLAGLGTGKAFFQYGGFIANSSLATIEGHPRSIIIDFNDNELDATRSGPIDHDPPPAGGGTAVCALGAIIDLMGTYGGAGHSPSNVAGNGGTYNPLKTTFASPFERITAVWPRLASGFCLYSTKNSLQAVYGVGGSALIGVREIWSQDGIPGGRKAGVWAGQTFYCYTNQGPARLVGDSPGPETSFALDVHDLMRRNFTASSVTVAYEPQDKLVLFCGFLLEGYNANRWVAIPYRLMDGAWGPPIPLPGQPKGAVTIDSQLYLVIGGALRPWDKTGGTGIVDGRWLLGTGALESGAPGRRKRPRRACSIGNSASIEVRLYDNADRSGTPVATWNCGNRRYGKWKRMAPKSDLFSIEFYGTTPGQMVWNTMIEGYVDPRRER